jgi:hypothetical protein
MLQDVQHPGPAQVGKAQVGPAQIDPMQVGLSAQKDKIRLSKLTSASNHKKKPTARMKLEARPAARGTRA